MTNEGRNIMRHAAQRSTRDKIVLALGLVLLTIWCVAGGIALGVSLEAAGAPVWVLWILSVVLVTATGAFLYMVSGIELKLRKQPEELIRVLFGPSDTTVHVSETSERLKELQDEDR